MGATDTTAPVFQRAEADALRARELRDDDSPLHERRILSWLGPSAGLEHGDASLALLREPAVGRSFDKTAQGAAAEAQF